MDSALVCVSWSITHAGLIALMIIPCFCLPSLSSCLSVALFLWHRNTYRPGGQDYWEIAGNEKSWFEGTYWEYEMCKFTIIYKQLCLFDWFIPLIVPIYCTHLWFYGQILKLKNLGVVWTDFVQQFVLVLQVVWKVIWLPCSFVQKKSNIQRSFTLWGPLDLLSIYHLLYLKFFKVKFYL